MLDQDVQSRVDAYRGNPQALQQKYSVSKDLLDLMALQKLTKEKESAARELQMAMAAQQGQGPGTVRDQLQQKALGMTKQELEKQQIELLQQKQQQQQQNMQRLAQSGVAQNPAPNMAAPGFASGGIIAFANGAEVPKVHGIAGAPSSDPYSEINVARDKVRRGEPLTERDEALLRNAEQMRIRKLGPDAQVNPLKPPVVGRQPDGTAPKISMQEAQGVVGNVGAASTPGYAGPNPLDQQRALERSVVIPQQAAPAAKYQGTPSDAIREAAERAGILAPFKQPTVSGSAPPAPTRSMGGGGGGGGGGQQAGLGAITPTKVDLSGAPQPVDITQFSPESEADKAFRQSVRGAARSASQQDPAAIERARELAKTELSLTPKEREKMEANLAAREAMTREQMDPERLARSRLIQSLAAMSGHSTLGGGLANLAITGENVASRQDAARRAQMIEDQGYGEKIMGLDMAARKGGLEMYDKEAGRQSEMARTGISALGSLGSAMENANATRTQAAASFQSARLTDWNNVQVNEAKMANDLKLHQLNKDSAREVANINARAHADLAAATREATTESKRREAIERFMKVQTEAERVLDSRYAVQIKGVQKLIENAAAMNKPADKARAEADKELILAAQERDRQKLIRQTQDALIQVGAGSAGSAGKWGDVTVKPSK
jgi:hypothetical protein